MFMEIIILSEGRVLQGEGSIANGQIAIQTEFHVQKSHRLNSPNTLKDCGLARCS